MHNTCTSDAPNFPRFLGLPVQDFAGVKHLFVIFRKHMLAICFGVVAFPALAEASFVLPSERKIVLHEMLFVDEYDGLTLHVAFLWPDITQVDLVDEVEITETDMVFLCQEFALPKVVAQGAVAHRIVIAFSDVPVEFGVPTPDALQIFESYLVTNNTCEWEAF